MKILQAPTEIAAQMGTLSKALNRIGVEAAAYNTFHSYLGYRDYLYNVDEFELEWLRPEIIRYFDIFHFHYGQTLARDYADLEEIERLGKPMLMHHWGNDVRTYDIAARNNPFVYTGDSPPPEVVHKRLTTLSGYVNDAIVQDYEVYPYVAPYYKRVHVVPIAFDVAAVNPVYPSLSQQEDPLVVHAPTNPQFKGTQDIEQALAALRKEGVHFRYRRIERMKNEEALRLYRAADIVIDQVLCGSYGLLAVESMSLGKPVVGYIRPDLANTFPEVPPIVSASPDALFDVLRELLQSAERRVFKGEQGRVYAEKYHSVDVVVKQLTAIYRTLSDR